MIAGQDGAGIQKDHDFGGGTGAAAPLRPDAAQRGERKYRPVT